MIAGILAIIVGVVLLIAFLVFLELVPRFGANFKEEVQRLGMAQGAIGIISIGVGVWTMGYWIWVILIVAGILSALGLLVWLPQMEKHFNKFIKTLTTLQTIVGVLSINAGILALLG